MITHGITEPRANQWCFHLVYRNHEGLECGLVDTVGPKRATYTSNWWHNGKESACQCRKHKRHGFNPWVREIPWSGKRQPIPMFLPGKFHGQRSLAGYSPWGRKESDTAKRLSTPCITSPLTSEKSLTVRHLPRPRGRYKFSKILIFICKL